jgi:hypothetical protein
MELAEMDDQDVSEMSEIEIWGPRFVGISIEACKRHSGSLIALHHASISE